ncbi:MAG: hypothetical protein RLZZ215_2845 [Pseudomonadota bacterium]|jgi:hypothetical protein
MSLAHAQGLRDALLKLRDTYAPPTAEEAKLFSHILTTMDEAKSRLHDLPVAADLPASLPLPDFSSPPKSVPLSSIPSTVKKPSPAVYYPAEPVETRW